MFIIGILIHITFLFSIFDIYFKSPIVKNVQPFRPIHEAPADRLVLFVVDGLRAESFLNYTTMPYLRSIANTNGRWGISSTRVPTESRPGHVAIIAGFYEDPSAVAKGWKENPVDFDSVFNQTLYTWCWGTYDILDIFTKVTVDNHIYVDKMDPYDQTFDANKNTKLLDDWVFQRVKSFFKRAKHNADLNEKLHKKKIILFLHLLGTDTAGHTHKPKTPNFLETIKFVDENIKDIEGVIKDFYSDDGRTTFLMTSDHGMTDWGSHGTGDDHETKTPYVLWGAGVQKIFDNEKVDDPETLAMNLNHRYDVEQADLTPLMASFISVPVPVNSIGKLPMKLLNMSLENKAKATYSNSRQLLSQYDKKRVDVEVHALSLLYQPFEPLNKRKVEEIINITQNLLEAEDYEKLIIFSTEIMDLSLSGLIYYHNYYQKPLLLTVTFSFMGWIAYLMRILLEQNMNTQSVISEKFKTSSLGHRIDTVIRTIFLFLSISAVYLIYAQNLPIQYYVYFIMPILLWVCALLPTKLWINTFTQTRTKMRIPILLIELISYFVGAMAMGASFTYRWMLSIPLLGMSLWPFFSSSAKNLPKSILVAWPIGCLMLSVFTFIPVVGKHVFIELVIAAGILWLSVIVGYSWSNHTNNECVESKRERAVCVMQMLLLISSLFIIFTQSKRFENENPVSPTLQTFCWIYAVILPVLPLLYSKRVVSRLLGINTSILNFYLLLSVAHEGLFIVTLIFNTACWIMIEFNLLNQQNVKVTECSFGKENIQNTSISLTLLERSISSHDFRRAFFFTLYIIVAYFGTGNIASLNSFEVRWVICFTTSFQPFIITTLILLKTLSPFIIVGCSFRAIQHLTKAPTGYLIVIVLIYSNVMGIQLLYYVKNTGSWLDIGTSISQYVIVQVITVFIVLMNQLTKLLTAIDIIHGTKKIYKNRKKHI